MEQKVEQITAHFFRHEAGNLRAALTRVLGMAYLDFVEDVIQEAMYRALTKWPVGGIPPNPSGWIFRTARNIAIDFIRRDKLFADKAEEIAQYMQNLYPDETGGMPEELIEDSLLRMVFTCCHPDLSPESRIVMTLKIVCSFHNREIAGALLKKQDAVEKMVSRGKQTLKQVIDLESSLQDHDIQARLEDVLQVVYLMFNEGYRATSGEKLIKEPVCLEAIRLARLLARHPASAKPQTHALVALLLFHASRFPSRVDQQGHLLLLQHQDRSEWDRDIMQDALEYLNRAATGEEVSVFHLLAGIAACHAYAPDYASTDWGMILGFYDLLIEFNSSPVILLNRVVAVLQVQGADAARSALKELEALPKINIYYLYYMVAAQIEFRSDRLDESIQLLEKAKSLTNNIVEKNHIQRKIDDLLERS